MWRSLYDPLLQALTATWAAFIRSNSSDGKEIQDLFREKIYPEIALILVLVVVSFGVFYYYYLNLRFGRYYSIKTWWAILGIASIVAGIITYWKAHKILDNPLVDVSNHLLWIGIINAVYAAILFFIFSLMIKWRSPMGKRTPI